MFIVALCTLMLLSRLSCPTLCNPIDSSLPGSPVPGILQARILEWVAISFSHAWKWKLKVKSLSCVQLLATPWTAAYQAPPSMGFARHPIHVSCMKALRNISCHISKQGCHSHQWLQPSNMSWWAWGNSERKRVSAIEQPSDWSHSPMVSLRKLRMWKYRILSPDRWGTYQRNNFRQPRLLHLPIHRKALNSLTWDIWFSLINNNHLTLILPTPCCKSSI